jgi:O-6-methylguanine DNA methyltransferase
MLRSSLSPWSHDHLIDLYHRAVTTRVETRAVCGKREKDVPDKRMAVERIHIGSCETPLGNVWIAASDAGVRVVTVPGAAREDCLYEAGRRSTGDIEIAEGGEIVDLACRELRDYFRGRLTEFSVQLDLRGTDFQRRVWDAVYHVPYGETVNYRDIARQIGAPNAYRAVGAANGANPAAIIVPCHRLVGVTGGLRGYGGGLHQKQALLDLEARTIGADG